MAKDGNQFRYYGNGPWIFDAAVGEVYPGQTVTVSAEQREHLAKLAEAGKVTITLVPVAEAEKAEADQRKAHKQDAETPR